MINKLILGAKEKIVFAGEEREGQALDIMQGAHGVHLKGVREVKVGGDIVKIQDYDIAIDIESEFIYLPDDIFE